MDYREAKTRLVAAQKILFESTSSLEKFSSLRQLIYGIHPRTDEVMHILDAQASQLQKLMGGEFFTFAIESLPEESEEEKKRKKFIVLFWNSWNKLKGEVERVQVEMEKAQATNDSLSKSHHWSRVFNFAKGPFGIVTIIAIAVALVAQMTSVKLTIRNNGCATLIPSSSLSVPLPGISLPKDPIVSGGVGSATIPALPYVIDGTGKSALRITALKFGMTFELGSVSDVTLDGESLLGKVTSTRLSKNSPHEIRFTCR